MLSNRPWGILTVYTAGSPTRSLFIMAHRSVLVKAAILLEKGNAFVQQLRSDCWIVGFREVYQTIRQQLMKTFPF